MRAKQKQINSLMAENEALNNRLLPILEDEYEFLKKFKALAFKGKTYKEIASILECDVQYLYAKARRYKITVTKPWANVGQYFTTMLEMNIQGHAYADIAKKFKVSKVCIHKIFAKNGYIDFRDEKIIHNTAGAREFAENYRMATELDISRVHRSASNKMDIKTTQERWSDV